MQSIIKNIILIVGCLAFCQVAYGQRISVKTDALKLAMATPNIGVEFATTKHTSLSADVSYGFMMYGFKEANFWCVQPEWRYWLSGIRMTGFYIGLSGLGLQYDFITQKKNIIGDAIGGGLSIGNVWMLSDRWNIEATFGFGFVGFRNKESYITDSYQDITSLSGKKSNNEGYFWLPTKFSASISYVLY